MSVKKSPPRARGPQLVLPEDFCRIYADDIHISLYYRGLAESPPRFPAPVKGIPIAEVERWVRTRGMAFAKARAEHKARHPKKFARSKSKATLPPSSTEQPSSGEPS